MNCDCLETVLDRVKGHILERLPKHEPESVRINWENRSLRLDTGRFHVPLLISVKYRRLKNSGEPYSKFTNESTSIAMSFCPFCGKSTKQEEAA